MACNIFISFYLTKCLICIVGNPRVTPEVTRDVCLLARMMAANMYFSQIEDLMFEVSNMLVIVLIIYFYLLDMTLDLLVFFAFAVVYVALH